MREELKIFLTAVMFYTRIPCPSWVDHSEAYINKSIRYFPLIGWIVGICSSLFLFTGAELITPLFGALLYLASSVWITGAFHEDGLADVCDGFGGGWTKEDVLRIMKDSRVGTYGVVGLVLVLLAKTFLVAEFFYQFNYLIISLIVVNAHTMSRFAAASIVFTDDYAREDAKSKSKPVAKSFSKLNLGVALLLTLVPFSSLIAFTSNYFWLLILPVIIIVRLLLSRLFDKRLGGYTGDCLGAAQQLTEITFYFAALIICKYF